MASSICTRVINVNLCWSANIGVSMCRSPLKKVTYGFMLTSLAMLSMFCLSYLDSLCDRKLVAIQLLFCRVLPPEYV